jgi:sugar/nucleoside kinase (ribokinase family)
MVVVFGTICLDRLRRIEILPRPGGYAEILDEHLMLGGEAANTASALATWGAEVKLVGNDLGLQDQGENIANLLAERGLWVETSQPSGGGHRTPVCDIYVAKDGDRTMFGLGFADMEPDLGAIPLVPGAWFTGEPNMGRGARDAVRLAQAANMRIYLMDFFQPDDPVRPGDFWQSSTDWVGTRGNTQKNVAWVKGFVAEKGAFTILSDGPNGFVFGGPDHPTRAYPPYPAPSVVDMTGAGDAFRAGMLYGLDSSWPIAECLRFASAAGSLSCGLLGGSDAPTRAAVEALIALHPEIGRGYE